MTIVDIFRISLRRWYVVLVGLALTGLLVMHIQTKPGVFWARTSVVLLAPKSATNPNAITITSGALVQTAGVVARLVNNRSDGLLPSSPDVTLADQGVPDGSVVYQPNIGGQWVSNYVSAEIIVDVTAPDPALVVARTDRLVAKIQHTLRAIQDEQDVDTLNQISSRRSVAPPQVIYDVGQPRRAEAVALLLGVALTLSVAVTFDSWLARRRSRHPAKARDVRRPLATA